MAHKTWRDLLRPIIKEVIDANNGKTEKEIRKILRQIPKDYRGYHPYRIWCDEVNKQFGKIKPKKYDKNQEELF